MIKRPCRTFTVKIREDTLQDMNNNNKRLLKLITYLIYIGFVEEETEYSIKFESCIKRRAGLIEKNSNTSKVRVNIKKGDLNKICYLSKNNTFF